MELLHSFLSEQMTERIGWVLIHFLWQGIAIATLMWCVLKALSKASANTRYIAACAGLLLMVAAPITTFMILAPDAPVTVSTPAAPPTLPTMDTAPAATRTIVVEAVETDPLPKPSLIETLTAKLETALPYCVIGWAIGVAILSVWYLGGWCQLQKLRRIGTKTVSEAVAQKTSELANRLGVKRAIHITESALVQVPTVIGWLKPVILLPATALTGLDEFQLTAMIAHELAHIKRCDYLINIIQTVVEILGFYHPAVWWASRQIRTERENCCDDMAVALVQNRKHYAGALFTMEAIRTKQHNLAVAANGGHLTNRISRLAGKPENHQKSGWIPSVVTILLVATILIATSMAMSNKAKVEPTEINSEDVHSYQVNRKVSDFPETEDFSTPESAYAAINRVMAADDPEGWIRVSKKSLQKRLAQAYKGHEPKVDAEWSKVVLNAHILEVRIKDDEAVVIAQFPQDLSSKPIREPIDYRHLVLENGNWLNTGENRYDTIEQAREKFDQILQRDQQTEQAYDNVLEKSEMFKQKAKELFEKLRTADYESILKNYDEKTGRWSQDGWKKLDIDYTVHTSWPGFAAWVCKTFGNNPIVAVELGDVFISEKKESLNNKFRVPAIPYKVALQDGGVLQGDLYFEYRNSNMRWQPTEGIDWHLQKKSIKYPSLESNAPNDKIIVPGERIGRFIFGMTKDELLEILGKPNLIFLGEQRFTLEQLPDKYYMSFDHISFRIQDGSVREITAISPFYTFADGLKVGDSEKKVKQTFGDNFGLEETEYKDFLSYEDRGLVFEIDKHDRTIMEINVSPITPMPQILTTGYVVSVSAEMPELKGLIPEEKSNGIIMSPEKFEKILRAIQSNPQAKMIANPRILQNDKEEGKVAIIEEIPYTYQDGKTKYRDIGVKLTVTPHLSSDGKRVRTDVTFSSTRFEQDLISDTYTLSPTLLSGQAIALGGHQTEPGMKEILFIQPTILDNQTSVPSPQSSDSPPAMMGGGMGGFVNLPGGLGGMKTEDAIKFPINWDEMNKKYQEQMRAKDPAKFDAAMEKATQTEEAKQKLLETMIDFSSLTVDSTIEEAINLMRNSSTPPLPIVVLWSDLSENAYIEKDQAIGVDGLGVMKLQTGLRMILRSLSSSDIRDVDFAVEDGVITIATPKSLPGLYVTQMYDVADLMNPPANFNSDNSFRGMGMGGGMMGGTAPKYTEQMKERIEKLKQDIKKIVPESWYDNGGEGRMDTHGQTKLLIYQTPQMHDKIKTYLDELRVELSKQIAVEARFLLITDSFLEDIGLDTSVGTDYETPGGVGELVVGPANSEEILAALEHKPLDEQIFPELNAPTQKLQVLDDLQAEFILRATQAHKDAKQVQAPKVIVLSGEGASMQIMTDIAYKTGSTFISDSVTNGNTTTTFSNFDPEIEKVKTGITLDVQPTLQNNDKDIVIKGHMLYSDILEEQTHGEGDKTYSIPIMEVANIPIHAQIKSGGTILVEGPELTVHREVENKSNIPVIGGLFKNRSKVTDKQRLLVLIKPTFIIQDEVEPPVPMGGGIHRGGMGGARIGGMRSVDKTHDAARSGIRYGGYATPDELKNTKKLETK